MLTAYQIMGYLVLLPAAALLPALACLGLWRWRPRRSALVAAIAWTLYTLYESGMKYRILCGGECNIRVDLLVIYPLLLGLTLLAVVSALWPGRPTAPSAPPSAG
jgi:hypothetical protein